jgi:hypothetical protein
MAKGMIQENMGRPDSDELTLDAVKKNIEMPPELQEAYERVVIAGMKVMFSSQTHRIMLKELQKQGPVAQRLGQGIAGLMLLLFKESNNTMPPQVIFPAGIELMMQAVDFMRKTNMAKVTNQDIGQAVQVMIEVIVSKFGVDPAQFEQMINSYDNTAVDAARQQMGGAA